MQLENQEVITVKNEKGGYTSKIRDPEPHESGKSNRRACRTCGREIRQHKQKVFGRWICNLVVMDNGHSVHVSREKELNKQGIKSIQKWSEA